MSIEWREPRRCEEVLVRAGVFKGADGLRAFAESDEFWSERPYGTRLYFGGGAFDYLHRDVLRAAVRVLDTVTPPEEESPAPSPREGAEGSEVRDDLMAALTEISEGAGPYSRDRLTHAENTIEHMKEIARAVLAKARGEGS